MEIILILGIILFSAILHEIAHGYVADRLGDPTARLLGRLTLDPRPHIDPVMSILIPLMLILSGSPVIFGGAKPVPVDEFNLRDGRKDMALVSLAGPLTNLIIAIIAAALFHITQLPLASALIPDFFLYFLSFFFALVVRFNLLLAIFNLLPIPPLDGSKIFSLFLPEREARQYLSIGSFGMFILFFLLLFPIAGFSLGDVIGHLVGFSQSLLLP